MSTYRDARRNMRNRLFGLAAAVVTVTVIAVALLGTAVQEASKKLPVSPYVALAGGVVPQPDTQLVQPRLGAGADDVATEDVVLRRRLARMQYENERIVRRFLAEHHVTGPDVDQIRASQFIDLLESALAKDARVEVKYAVLAIYRRFPRDMLRHDPFALFLADPDAELRRLAVLGYGAHGRDKRWRAIADLAADPDARVRSAVATSLTGLRDEPVTALLADMLFDADDEVVASVGKALGMSLRRDLPERFAEACGHERAAVRLAACDALGIARGRAAGPILTTFLQDSDWRVRRTAIRGLSRLRGPAGLAAARSLESVAAQVGLPRTDRFEAIQALAGVPEIVNRERLRNVATSDADPVLRLVACRAALSHGDLSVTDSLLALLHVEQGEFCDDEDQDFVRATAEVTLREALEIEGPEGAMYVEQAVPARLRAAQRESIAYSPTRLVELW